MNTLTPDAMNPIQISSSQGSEPTVEASIESVNSREQKISASASQVLTEHHALSSVEIGIQVSPQDFISASESSFPETRNIGIGPPIDTRVPQPRKIPGPAEPPRRQIVQILPRQLSRCESFFRDCVDIICCCCTPPED